MGHTTTSGLTIIRCWSVGGRFVERLTRQVSPILRLIDAVYARIVGSVVIADIAIRKYWIPGLSRGSIDHDCDSTERRSSPSPHAKLGLASNSTARSLGFVDRQKD